MYWNCVLHFENTYLPQEYVLKTQLGVYCVHCSQGYVRELHSALLHSVEFWWNIVGELKLRPFNCYDTQALPLLHGTRRALKTIQGKE